MTYEIYKITNLVNGKLYIGQTRAGHKKRLKTHINQGSCPALMAAFEKFGLDSFKIEVIDNLATSKEELDQKEIDYIARFESLTPNGYNICLGGETPDAAVMQGQSGRKNKRGYIGIRPRGGAFRARCTRDGTCKTSTCYWDIEDAAKAYDYLALEMYGDTARLNFPNLRDQYKTHSVELKTAKAGQHFRDRAIPNAKGKYSKFRGVTNHNDRWVVQFYPGKKQKKICVGQLSNELEAAQIYDNLAIQHFGLDAELNFPNSLYNFLALIPGWGLGMES